VVTPPQAHPGCAVQAQEFPGTPERFESADRFGAFTIAGTKGERSNTPGIAS
jgi:hypothetical protein